MKFEYSLREKYVAFLLNWDIAWNKWVIYNLHLFHDYVDLYEV